MFAFRRGGEPPVFPSERKDGRSLTSARMVLTPGEITTGTHDRVATAGSNGLAQVVTTPGARATRVARDTRATGGC
ncbi:hypothetical protein [Demequina pelophila]|uniref:hypothetical protein n=1 Tax=Demequina pelophila TaxID=1638984 RepID=UPI000782D5B9|nr:hypothetical protein [Demequina pelophila]